EPGAQRHGELATRVDVGAAAERAQQTKQGKRRVGLQRVVHEVRISVERAVDGSVGRADRLRTIDVHRRAHPGDDGLHVDAVAEEPWGSGMERAVHSTGVYQLDPRRARALATRPPRLSLRSTPAG